MYVFGNPTSDERHCCMFSSCTALLFLETVQTKLATRRSAILIWTPLLYMNDYTRTTSQ